MINTVDFRFNVLSCFEA